MLTLYKLSQGAHREDLGILDKGHLFSFFCQCIKSFINKLCLSVSGALPGSRLGAAKAAIQQVLRWLVCLCSGSQDKNFKYI